MATNVTVKTVTAQVVVTHPNGTQLTIDPGDEKFFQISDGEFCAITEVPIDPDAPTVDNELPTPPAEKFLETWRKVVDAIKDQIHEDLGGGEVTPAKE